MTPDLADARELASVLRARLAELDAEHCRNTTHICSARHRIAARVNELNNEISRLDAEHRARTQSLRDDLRRVTDLLTRHAATAIPAGVVRHADGTIDFQWGEP